jgi:hypothetical protein
MEYIQYRCKEGRSSSDVDKGGAEPGESESSVLPPGRSVLCPVVHIGNYQIPSWLFHSVGNRVSRRRRYIIRYRTTSHGFDNSGFLLP